MFKSNFEVWTNELIEEESKDLKETNILAVCEEYFDVWNEQLFPLLRRQNKSCYKYLVMLFHKNGNMNVTEATLQKYFSIIRKRRGIAIQPLTAVAVTKKLDMSSRPGEDIGSVHIPERPFIAPKTSVGSISGIGQGGSGNIYSKSSKTPPMDYEDMRDELKRLKEERINGWGEWTGIDEWLWLEKLELIEEYNRIYFNDVWNIKGNQMKFMAFAKIKTDDAMKLYDLLCEKVVVKREV